MKGRSRVGVLLFALGGSAALAHAAEAPLQGMTGSDGGVVVEWIPDQLLSRSARGEKLRLRDFPLGDETVDLDIEPFTVTSERSVFVLGGERGQDQTLDFDPASVALFRGRVRGRAGSHVVLALHEGRYTGFIDPGNGAPRHRISSRGRDGRLLGAGRASVFQTGAAPGLPADVPFCGVDASHSPVHAYALSAASAAASTPQKGLRELELAVETDYELFTLFGDASEAAAYLVALYAELSEIYVRDTQTRVELVFARIWNHPNDLFNAVNPSPLAEFRSYWNSNMGAVSRDAAQLLSGRRDYPFGGQAYLSALCGANAYSVVGYAMGSFPDPSVPSPYSYDIMVTAHELGHNAGTGHTHDAPNFVDTCDDPLTTPQRGTIMSYCGQTWSGGNANHDQYFHERTQQNIVAYVAGASCVVLDCNLNGIADALDLGGTSADSNANGVPDECEDCNTNTVLDPQDIAAMTSADLDGNGVPDECQPDCNANSIPDEQDIADATSSDAHGNDVPDECEADCDLNSISDYTQIQLDMTLDIDRNAVLDACQDCDGDLLPDLAELDGAHDLFLASGLAGSPLRRFLARTGVRALTSSGATIARAQDLIVTSDARVLVTSADDARVLEFDRTGAYVGDLVSAGAGGLSQPRGLVLAPDGRLLVASHGSDSVLAFDPDGTPLGTFVAAGAGGLSGPFGLAFGPNGNLFVSDDDDAVLEFDGATGAYVRDFVPASNSGGLERARALLFKPDGHLLVTSYGGDETLAFHGLTGAPLGRWAKSGTATILNQISPWGLRVGPNGNVFIVRTGEAFSSTADPNDHDHDHGALHLTNAQINEFDVSSGDFIRSHVNGNDHGMEFPTGFDWIPGDDVDCNQNGVKDDCDLAAGSSQDANTNDLPDECELDCNLNGRSDRLDLIPLGESYDCNFNGVPDECDASGACEPGAELSCGDGFDNDQDGRIDCIDLDCDATPACPGEIVLFADFETGSDGFGYIDDAFRGTSQPGYASGALAAGGGFYGTDALGVTLGGINSATVVGMSGGWQRSVNLAVDAELELTLRYSLTLGADYERVEYAQILVSLDGTLLGTPPGDFVTQLNGDQNGGPDLVTGWMVFELDLGLLAAGNHTLVIGGYNNQKNSASEVTKMRLDDVALLSAGPLCLGPDTDADGWPDSCDNCALAPNPGQEDGGGVGGGSAPDGIGDACQCGDVDDDGDVDLDDLLAYRTALADPAAQLSAPGEAKCEVLPTPNGCAIDSVAVMARALALPPFAPGISQVCAAATGP